MKNIRVLIVEDEPIIAADLADRLNDMGYEVAQQCSSGETAIAFLAEEQVDLVLMDIQLDGAMDGIETAAVILRKHPTPIIYLTSNTEPATFARAKETRPAAFLTKPFRGKDLLHAIELAISNSAQSSLANTAPETTPTTHLFKDRLFIKVKDRMIRLFFNDILWLEADDYYCKLVTSEKEYLITHPLKQMGESLVAIPEFMRIHRSYIVNLAHVEEIGDVFVSVQKKQIPLNKSSRGELITRLQQI
jgi:DNA-binding LytR/AlgR family response regulator